MSAPPYEVPDPSWDAAVLGTVACVPVPEGFAAAVVAAVGGERPPTKRRRAWLAAGVLAASIVLTVVAWPRADSHVEADSMRRSIALGDGAVAVLEPGASVRWSDNRGDVVVEQAQGRVFYRVDPGGSFAVETPAGRLTVQGTCFEVEVTNMPTSKKRIAGAAIGAAVVVAAVHEGSVLFTTERGEQHADAGEQVISRAGETPRRVASTDPTTTLAHARLRIDGQRQRLRELERQLASVQAGEDRRTSPDDDETPAQRAERCVQGGGVACEWVEPSADLLDELADCGLAWVDHPAAVHGKIDPSPEFVAAATLSSEEIRQLEGVNRAYLRLDEQAHRDLFLALGGDAAIADRLSAGAIRGWLDAHVSRATRDDTSRLVAHERAGRREVPERIDDPAARYVRFELDDGERYEALVAERLGDARARELRLIGDGWLGNHSIMGAGCETK